MSYLLLVWGAEPCEVGSPETIELIDRLMLRDDPAYPRLVPYYLPIEQAEDPSDHEDDARPEGDED